MAKTVKLDRNRNFTGSVAEMLCAEIRRDRQVKDASIHSMTELGEIVVDIDFDRRWTRKFCDEECDIMVHFYFGQAGGTRSGDLAISVDLDDPARGGFSVAPKSQQNEGGTMVIVDTKVFAGMARKVVQAAKNHGEVHWGGDG